MGRAAHCVAPARGEASRMVTVLGLFPLGAMHALLFAAAWLRFD